MDKPSVYHEGIRTEVVEFIPQEYSKVLEIGCGKGGFRAIFLIIVNIGV